MSAKRAGEKLAGSGALLQQIFEESFEESRLPAGWYTDTFFPKYSPGCWDCSGWDGVIVPLPHPAWKRLLVEVEVDGVLQGSTAYCGTDSRTGLQLQLRPASTPCHAASDGGYALAQSKKPVPLDNGATTLTFEWTASSMRVLAGKDEILSSPNRCKSAKAGTIHMGFSKCVIRRIRVQGEAEKNLPAPLKAITKGYPLEVTVDFNDDLMACAWSHKTFDSLFSELKSWGCRRVSWNDLGREADGYFDFAPHEITKHGKETFRHVGDIFTAAVDHAHKEGLELVGVLKPLDMAIHVSSYPPNCEEARRHGRINRIGASTCWATHMAADNQHLLTTRKPSAYGPAINSVWTRIELVKDDAEPAALKADDISLIVSDDNDTYHPYSRSISKSEFVEERPVYESTPSGVRPTAVKKLVRIIRLDGLRIAEPFMAISVAGSARSFGNRLCDLVHIFGDKGEETRITYGLSLRGHDFAERISSGPTDGSQTVIKEVKGGFKFNCFTGSPSVTIVSGGEAIMLPLVLDAGNPSWLALAKGKDRSPVAIMSPSFPETRRLWMTWIEAMLDAGADGIDIRFGNHHCDFAWIEYGFEQPVRDEMLKRTGVDIWETDDFDTDLWRRLRGEGYTQFIREASAVVRGRGKKLTLHTDGFFDCAPGRGGGLNIVCDWRSWLKEKLCDSVTGKSLWPDSQFAYEVIEVAHAHGIPVSYAPYCNNFFEDHSAVNHTGGSPKGCEMPVARLMDWGRRSGFDSFLFYECASALRARPDGTIGFRPNAEALRQVFKK